jgi:DNA-binding response OmpR family regulator
MDAADVELFPMTQFARFSAQTTADALRLIERVRPRIIAVDWDFGSIDAADVCAAARRTASSLVLVTMADPNRVPAALTAGCQTVLLRPLSANLVAARLGRLHREMAFLPPARRGASPATPCGTNRVWPETACPTCNTLGATSFEFSSYRRMWYACLACSSVWLGRRQE